MSALLPETDSEDELAPGWEERATLDGKVYYANHETKTTQWTHPRTGKKKRVAGELPYGWEKKVTEDGHVFYVDHINKKTTYTDPRLAFAVEETESSDDIRQRFDASTNALQILHGRDLSGKTVIVTGANCGIGFETARSLAYHGAEVVMACRSKEKTENAISEIKKERPHAKLEWIHLDLSSLRSVEKFVKEFQAKYSTLHILILNAGVFCPPYILTEDNFESTFQINHLGHFYMTKLLEPQMIQAGSCRVVVVSSESHRFSYINKENISEEKLSPSTYKNYIGLIAYNNSKLCNVLFSNELNRKLSSKGIYCNSIHPGNMVSSYLSRSWWLYRLLFALVRPFTKSLQQAASTSVYCATVPELEGVGGMYFNNCCRCQPSKASEDEELAKILWNMSEEMIKKALEQY